MHSGVALFQALELATTSRLSAQLRRLPLPDGVLDVIRIAAGCEETLDKAAALCRRPRKFVKSAAELYVLQVLLQPGVDCYRTLGVREDTPREEIRAHLKWLLMWLHPDRAGVEWQTAYTPRVLAAWRAIDRGLPSIEASAPHKAESRMIGLQHRPQRKRFPTRRRHSSRSARWLAAAAALLALLFLFGLPHWEDWSATQAEAFDVMQTIEGGAKVEARSDMRAEETRRPPESSTK